MKTNKALAVFITLTSASLLQAGMLFWLAQEFNLIIILFIVVLPVLLFLDICRQKHLYTPYTPNVLSVVLIMGGLGMSLGSMLDVSLLARQLCLTNEKLLLDMAYHQHNVQDIINFAVAFMLLLCVPSCVIFCPSQQTEVNSKPNIHRHAVAAITMLLAMLYLPLILSSLPSVLLKSNTLVAAADSAITNALNLSPFVQHYALMLSCMVIGTYCGYKLYDPAKALWESCRTKWA